MSKASRPLAELPHAPEFDSSANAAHVVASTGWQFLFLKIIVATMLVQSFVVHHVIKGLIISNVLIVLLASGDVFRGVLRRMQVNPFMIFSVFLTIFFAWQSLSQLLNAIFKPHLTQLDPLTLVSGESPISSLLRQSTFTQSAYLAVSVLFFAYMVRLFLKKHNMDEMIRIARWGVLAFVGWGFAEWAVFLVSGVNIDFISNRITGDGNTFGNLQNIYLGGLNILRMNSLAGEPSMFAFSILPFAIIFYYLKDKSFYWLLAALLLSTSTTALVGLAIFAVMEVVMSRSIKFISILTIGLALMVAMNAEMVIDVWDFTVSKLRLEHVSGLERFRYFEGCIDLFVDSNILHQVFGYGFGYVRSTDGFSSLLVNVGVLGLGVFTVFLLYPVLAIKATTPYLRGLRIAMFVILGTILTSVPEFYIFHVWFFAALAWYEYLRQRPFLAVAKPAAVRT